MRDLALYDRDINFSGEIIEDTVLTPEYGTSLSFKFYDDYFSAQDNFRKRVSKGLNDLDINLNLVYTNKREKEAKAFVAVMEHLSTGFFVDESGDSTLLDFNLEYLPSGSNFVKLAFPTGAINSHDASRGNDIGIYKSLSGLSIIDYSVKEHEGLFDISLNLRTNRESPMRYWSGSSFLTSKSELSGGHNGQIAPHWGALTTTQKQGLKKFDIVHWTGKVFQEDANNSNQTQNFYFTRRDFGIVTPGETESSLAPNDHINTIATTGNQQLWSQEFSDIFTPDDGVTFGQSEKLNNLKFKNSVLESQTLQKNKNLIENLTLNFSNRTNKETRALLFFLEKKGSRVPFKVNLPQLYIKDKYFIVDSFNHTFVYYDVNDITVTLNEVVTYRDYIDSPMGFRLTTEDGKTLVTQKYTGSVPIPEDDTILNLLGFGDTGIDQVFDSKIITLDAKKESKDVSGKQYTEELGAGPTGVLEFELNWTNVINPYWGQEEGIEGDGGPDLDLNVIDPNGNLVNRFTTSVYERQPGFFNDDIGLWGSGSDTGTVKRGPEIIYYRNEPEEGTYTVFPTLYNNIGQNQGLVDYVEARIPYTFPPDILWRYTYWKWSLALFENGIGYLNNANVFSYYYQAQYVIDIRRNGNLVSSNTGYFNFNHDPAVVTLDPGQHARVGDTGQKFTITI